MDEFRAPSRPVRAEGSLYDVPVRAGVTQTPSVTNIAPTPNTAGGQSNAAPANQQNPVSPGVNPSLLGGFSPLQPAPAPQAMPSTPPTQAVQPMQVWQPVAAATPPVVAPAATVPTSTANPFASQPSVVTEFAPAPVAAPAPVSAAPRLTSDDFRRDFNMPRPQTIAQEVQVVAESSQAAQAEDAPYQPANSALAAATAPVEQAADQPPRGYTPFDIAAIEELDKPKNRLTAGRAWRKWMLSAGIVVFCLLLGTGGLLFAQTYSKAHKVFRGTGATAALTAGADKQKLKGEDSGRVNILLLGNGGLGHEAPDLTDTMIVASFDTVHKTATMLSVPRDLWVQVPSYGEMKINAAYEVGKYNAIGKIDNTNNNTKGVMAGFAMADKAVSTVLGIDINYNMLVNFTSFKQAVDAVGGVDVNVTEQLYDPTMAWENGGNPVLAPVGQQTMNGTKALMYVRSRETSSDFARGQRQRSLILALKSKVLTAGTLSNPLKVSGLINAFGDNLVTDFSLSEAMRAYELGKNVDNSKVQTLDLVTPPNNLLTTGTIKNASIDLPRAGLFQYADIQKYIQQLFNPPTTTATTSTSTTTTAPENAVISVLNGTGKAGLAGTKAAVLKAAGYTVGTVSNAPSQTYAKTVVVDLSNGANKNTRKYLETTYGVTAVTTLPDAAIQAGTANFVVILGSDQAL